MATVGGFEKPNLTVIAAFTSQEKRLVREAFLIYDFWAREFRRKKRCDLKIVV